MVCQALELFCVHHVLGIPLLTKRLDSCEPLRFCDRCGPHCSSDQTECLVLDLVKGLLIGLCCGWPRWGAILELGSDCSLVHSFKYFLACSPSGTRKLAKNSQPVSGFSFCLGNMLCPGLPLVKCDSKVCYFFILLQWGPIKSDGASFLLWG